MARRETTRVVLTALAGGASWAEALRIGVAVADPAEASVLTELAEAGEQPPAPEKLPFEPSIVGQLLAAAPADARPEVAELLIPVLRAMPARTLDLVPALILALACLVGLAAGGVYEIFLLPIWLRLAPELASLHLSLWPRILFGLAGPVLAGALLLEARQRQSRIWLLPAIIAGPLGLWIVPFLPSGKGRGRVGQRLSFDEPRLLRTLAASQRAGVDLRAVLRSLIRLEPSWLARRRLLKAVQSDSFLEQRQQLFRPALARTLQDLPGDRAGAGLLRAARLATIQPRATLTSGWVIGPALLLMAFGILVIATATQLAMAAVPTGTP